MKNLTVHELISFLQVVIPIGGLMRILFCLLVMAFQEDRESYKKRIFNVLVFIVVAECISGILYMVIRYF